MRIKTIFRLVLSGLLTASTIQTSFACGPESPSYFSYSVPDLEKFPEGHLGIVLSTYKVQFLYTAFHYFSDKGYSQEELGAVKDFYSSKQHTNPNYSVNRFMDYYDIEKPWLEARKKVLGINEIKFKGVFRYGKDFYQYLNCQEDSFLRAVSTLDDQILRFGSGSQEVMNWVAAQDMVFANCNPNENYTEAREGKPTKQFIPDLILNGEARIKADRLYQIACAYFYAEDFEKARQTFWQIVGDKKSPWRDISRYLIVRTFIRQSSLQSKDPADESANLEKADLEIKKILRDSEWKSIHSQTLKLQSLVQARLHPSDQLNQLAKIILRPQNDDQWADAMNDYMILLHKIPLPDHEKRDDLTKWLLKFHRENDEGSLKDSLSEWENSHQLRWLVAILSKIHPQHPKFEQIMEAAKNVSRNSSAYPTVAYYRALLMIEKGDKQQAINFLDLLLKMDDTVFPPQSRNLLVELRAPLANDFKEFLSLAPRKPHYPYYGYGQQLSSLPWDTENILIFGIPLGIQEKIVTEDMLPMHLRPGFDVIVWVKSVLLGNEDIAVKVASKVGQYIPELKEQFDRYVLAKNSEERFRESTLILLRNQLMNPGTGHDLTRTKFNTRPGKYEQRWWCFRYWNKEQKPVNDKSTFFPSGLLTPAHKEVANKEWNQLFETGSAQHYLLKRVLDWQEKVPKDPLIPEALYRLQRGLNPQDYYNCLEKETLTPLYQQVADLLRSKYPNSPEPPADESPY